MRTLIAEDQIYFQEDHVSVFWNSALHFVRVKWMGFSDGANYRYAMLQALALIRERSSQKLLIDLSDMRVILPDDQGWTSRIFLDKSNRSGLKMLAIVNPKNNYAQKSLQNIIAAIENRALYQRREFECPILAMEWLTASC